MIINKKRRNIICCILILFTCAAILFSNIKIKTKLVIKNNNIRFESIQFLQKTYIVKANGLNVFTLKQLMSGKSAEINKFLINKKINILCSSDSDIKLYSADGSLVSNYKISNEKIISLCTGDINSDGADEILMITAGLSGNSGGKISILSFKSEFEKLYEKPIENLKPWKIQICDVDGDHKTDISIGIYKATLFHPVMGKRPFIYNWEGEFISPKWLGSRLSQPFDDYVFCDMDNDGMDEIVAIENTEDNKKVISIYKWKGFGVELMISGEKYNDMKQIYVVNKNERKEVVVKAKANNIWRGYSIFYNNQKLFLNKGNSFMNLNVY